MAQKHLNVGMFGGLNIEYGGHPIQLPLDIHSITVQLLILLWDAGKRGISRDVILDSLYRESEISDPANSMRVNIYRLRKMIDKLPLPKHGYIVVDHGLYRWDDGEIKLQTDVSRMREYLSQSRKAGQEERKELLENACNLYKGEFLPDLAAEHWAAVRSMDFQKMYLYAVTQLYECYMEENQYEKAVALADRALKIYTYESFAVMKIDALMALGHFQKALDTLDDFSWTLFSDLGVTPSEEMIKRYDTISSRITSMDSTVNEVKMRLNETVINGAYYCAFPSFVDCYRVLNRLAIRNGQPVYLVNCSMTDSQGRRLEYGDKGLESAPILIKSIESTLRAGDVYTQSNNNQFLILLSGLTLENCSLVTDRISSNFHKMGGGGRGLKLDFRISTPADAQNQ